MIIRDDAGRQVTLFQYKVVSQKNMAQNILLRPGIRLSFHRGGRSVSSGSVPSRSSGCWRRQRPPLRMSRPGGRIEAFAGQPNVNRQFNVQWSTLGVYDGNVTADTANPRPIMNGGTCGLLGTGLTFMTRSRGASALTTEVR